MTIVADSSPLVVLINIEHISIFPELFGEVVIPPPVLAELASPRRPVDVREFAANPPSWLQVRAPTSNPPIPGLHPGEEAAINLATELNADLLIMDEKKGRTIATSRGLAVTGTVGLLERAAEENLLDLREAFQRLQRTDFWITPMLLSARLQLFEQRQIQARSRDPGRQH